MPSKLRGLPSTFGLALMRPTSATTLPVLIPLPPPPARLTARVAAETAAAEAAGVGIQFVFVERTGSAPAAAAIVAALGAIETQIGGSTREGR